MLKARKVQDGGGVSLDYTAEANIAAGSVVALDGGLLGVANLDIAEGELGAIDLSGVFEIDKVSGSVDAGARLYWDDDGTPVDSEAEPGAVTTNSSAGPYIGRAARSAASGDARIEVVLNIGDATPPPPPPPPPPGPP